MGLYTLDIPNWRPPLLNSVIGRHWSQAHRAKRLMADYLGTYALQQGVPRATGRRRVWLKVWGWPGKRTLPDKDAFDKLLLDSLVRVGLLLDDGARGLEGRLAVSFERAKDKRTVIVLEDCQE